MPEQADQLVVVMGIYRDSAGITYTVSINGSERWRKYVRFGQNKTNRVAGYAFVEAAHEQETVALRLRDEKLREIQP